MNHIYMERYDPDKNMHRFYQLYITSGILGDWLLIKEWGRQSSPGTVRKEWFATEAEAISADQKLAEVKQKKGYQVIQSD